MEAEVIPCNFTAIRKAARHISQFYDAALAQSGLRATQRAVLAHVARQGSPTMGGLASALVLDRTALNHNLKPLVRDGLVVVAGDVTDRRSKRVRLTKRGEARLAASEQAWMLAQVRFETAFGTKPAAALRQMLAKVASLDLSSASRIG